MKPIWKWVIGIVLGLLILAVLIGMPWIYGTLYGDNFTYGWHMGGPMMGGPRSLPFHTFAPFGGLFMMGIFRLGWLVLLGLGIYWLVRALTARRLPAKVCASCGRPAQPDWKHCPHCGANL